MVLNMTFLVFSRRLLANKHVTTNLYNLEPVTCMWSLLDGLNWVQCFSLFLSYSFNPFEWYGLNHIQYSLYGDKYAYVKMWIGIRNVQIHNYIYIYTCLYIGDWSGRKDKIGENVRKLISTIDFKRRAEITS